MRMDKFELAQSYFEDAADYLARYRALFYSQTMDHQGIKSRRVKCYIDLRLAVEATLKSAICYTASDEEDASKLLDRIVRFRHGITGLVGEAQGFFGLGDQDRAALEKCDVAKIELRYQAEAIPFRTPDDRAYYDTIGNDPWLSKIEALVRQMMDSLNNELKKQSKPVSAKDLTAKAMELFKGSLNGKK